MAGAEAQLTMEYVWSVVSSPSYRSWWIAFATTVFALSSAYYYILIRPLRKSIAESRNKVNRALANQRGENEDEDISDSETQETSLRSEADFERRGLDLVEYGSSGSEYGFKAASFGNETKPKRPVSDRDARELLAEIHTNPNRFLSHEELEIERESRREQLAQVLRTMRNAPEKFGECSLDEISEQLNMYL